MVRAAVIGCGDVSVVHLEAIQRIEGSALVAVCDRDPAVAQEVSAQYGVPSFTDPAELIEAVHPDVVHISTPHDQHVSIALGALEAGVSVLTEKPVAHTMADAERLVRWSAEHPDTCVGVCFQNRYNATSQAARDLLSSGELGAVLGAFATVAWHRDPSYYAKRPWRGERVHAGGGTLINQAIHTIDLLQWLLGDVTSVGGRAGTYLLDGIIDVEDSAQLILDHAGGVRSVMFATNTAPLDFPVSVEITTEQATLLIRGDLTITYADGRSEVVAERRLASGGRSYWGVSHELLIADFHAHAAAGKPFWIDPAEGVKSLSIIEQVYALSR
ncbi:MAG TPA: Gfo/Idh/MocA family oxidoreductase [Microlunatus sp.]|nr:Gfo/Idh/MocA family oxidoreductase [Microlunatus sp.]